MTMHFNLEENVPEGAVIKVVGVGGGGGNAVDHMVASNLNGVEFICANTDAQALRNSDGKVTVRLGETTTKGLGAGADPEVGRLAAVEDRERIADVLDGADMVFVTAGMGGGTGTGAAPIIAEVAKDLEILTIAVVTRPFSFEGGKRNKVAAAGIKELRENVDSLITIPNDKLLSELGDVPMLEAFQSANDVLYGAVRGIADLITNPGTINVDFADVRTVMSEMGVAMMGSGRSRGDTRAADAAHAAISSPLLDNVDLHGARGILVNVTGSSKLGIKEYSEVGEVVSEFADEDANIIMGLAVNEELEDELIVTVVATGIGQEDAVKAVEPKVKRVPMGTDGEPDWSELERATIDRRRVEAVASSAQPRSAAMGYKSEELIDIPTFLRRQAD